MKDFTKKLLCLLVALAMVFVLCACGNNNDDDDDDDDDDKKDKNDKKPTTSQVVSAGEVDTLTSLEGDWEVSFGFDLMSSLLGDMEAPEGMFDAIDSEMTLIFSFTDDEVSLLADPDDLEDFAKGVAKDLLSWYENGGLEEMYADLGLSEEELASMLDEIKDEMANVTAEEMFGEMDTNADGLIVFSEAEPYAFDGEILELDGEELEISYKKGVITVESATGDAEFMEGLKLKKR